MNKMKYHAVLVLLFSFLITAQGQYFSMNLVEPKLDTLCYPFEGALQLIIINHEGYTAMQNHNIMVKHGNRGSLPLYISPKDNEYFFRDSSGRIVKAFNRLNPSLDSLTNFFRALLVNSYQSTSKNESSNDLLAEEAPVDLILNKEYFLVAKVPQIGSLGRLDHYNPPDRTLENNVGLINRSGDLIIPYSYKSLNPLGNYFVAYQKDKVGLINAQNKVLVPIKFDYYKPETRNLYTFWKEEKCFAVFDLKSSKLIPLNGYDRLRYFEGLEKHGVVQVYKNGKYGLINKHFEEVIPLIYDEMKNYAHLGYCKVRKEGLYGFLDTTGHEMIPLLYPKIGDIFLNHRIWFANKEGKYGFLDSSGKEIIAAQYDRASNFYVDKAIVHKDGFASFIDKNGNLLIDYQYKQAQYQREQFVVTNEAGYVGLLNAELKEIISCKYKRISQAVGAKKYYWSAILENDTVHKYTKKGEQIN
jgi:hypothetical protein